MFTRPQSKCGEYDVYVGDDRVYFEHELYGEDDSLCAYHSGNKVIHDYDMAYCMSDEIRAWLDDNGYNTEDILG